MTRRPSESASILLTGNHLNFPPTGSPLLGKEPIDEERLPGYNSKEFNPVKPGAVLAKVIRFLSLL